MKRRDLIRRLEKAGFVFARHGGKRKFSDIPPDCPEKTRPLRVSRRRAGTKKNICLPADDAAAEKPVSFGGFNKCKPPLFFDREDRK